MAHYTVRHIILCILYISSNFCTLLSLETTVVSLPLMQFVLVAYDKPDRQQHIHSQHIHLVATKYLHSVGKVPGIRDSKVEHVRIHIVCEYDDDF